MIQISKKRFHKFMDRGGMTFSLMICVFAGGQSCVIFTIALKKGVKIVGKG